MSLCQKFLAQWLGATMLVKYFVCIQATKQICISNEKDNSSDMARGRLHARYRTFSQNLQSPSKFLSFVYSFVV